MTQRPGTGTQTIGARLRRLRLEQGLSQRDLSAPGVTYAYISRIEAGARQPSVKALRLLARKLGVTPEYLETGAELAGADLRELRLAEHELRLRLDGSTDSADVRALLEDAEGAADTAAVVRARILLGLDAAARGDHGAAIEQLEAVVGSELVHPAVRPDVYATLGRARAASGAPLGAIALFREALAALGPPSPENRAARVRYSSYLSYALTDAGDLAGARAVLGELARAAEPFDRTTSVRVHWSRGRLALEQARPLAALDSFRRAVALLEQSEDELSLARAHIACAEAELVAGAGTEAARPHLAEASLLLGLRPAAEDLAMLRRLEAACAVAEGDPALGVRLAGEAVELAGGIAAEVGPAWLALAEARAAAGEDDVDEAFRAAVEHLDRHGSVRDRTNGLRAYGRWLRNAGRERDALDIFERAADVASHLQGERVRS